MPIKITKRGKVWHYSGTVAGRRLRGTTGTSDKAIAQRIAAEKEQQTWAGHLDGPEATLTMAQAFIAYRQAEKPTRFLEKIEDYWRDTLVRKVTSGQIRQSAINLYPKAGPATRNRQVIVPTQAAINHAHALHGLPPVKVERFKVARKEMKYADEAWVKAFVEHASPHLGAMCRFMFETGARRAEATSLTWADVNFEERSALIRQTKVNRERTARLTPKILVALANIPSNRCPTAPVFDYERPDSVYQPWQSVIKRAGIEKMSPHACRHGFATTMLRNGVDAKTVAHHGGWQDVRTLLETYAHANRDPSVVDGVFGTNLPQTDHNEPLSRSKQRKN
jgi:integrase